MKTHAEEIASGRRFAFGANWAQFLEVLNDGRISQAEKSLRDMLGVSDLQGKSFLDVGSGSGLFSLAARRLSATVHSFDYDPKSVGCTRELWQRYYPEDLQWTIEVGSVLDREYLSRLGQFDVVYSWGVLHHTGNMWRSLGLVADLVKPGGTLFIAVYNDQGWASNLWRQVKKLYNRAPRPLSSIILWLAFVRLWGPTMLRDLLRARPFATWKSYQTTSRGMSPWRDVVDWVGGYPFEVAAPEKIVSFYHTRGFTLCKAKTVGRRLGCNEYVFEHVLT